MIRYAARINFDVACNMNFHAYPGFSTFVLDPFKNNLAFTYFQVMSRIVRFVLKVLDTPTNSLSFIGTILRSSIKT